MYRTNAEIESEIKDLEFTKHCIPYTNIFGDNNYHLIDATIMYLSGKVNLTNLYGLPTEYTTPHILEGLREAELWVDGDLDESPSEGWAPYVIKAYYEGPPLKACS